MREELTSITEESPPDLCGSPEHALWSAILISWIEDAKKVAPLSNAQSSTVDKMPVMLKRARKIVWGIQTSWTEQICSMIEVDYDWFVGAIYAMIFRTAEKEFKNIKDVDLFKTLLAQK